MIDLYTWTTPNGRKASIMLEETGLEYRVHTINIGKDEQFAPAFLAISPNNKIPAIVDQDAEGGPLSVFESAAILIYLAEKTGRFLPPAGRERVAAMEWVAWQMGGLGPMAGQLGYFGLRAPEKIPLAINRYKDEVRRLLGVMDGRLAQSRYLGGAEYGIADMLVYPWVVSVLDTLRKVDPDDPGLADASQRWLEAVGSRPAVVRGMAIPRV